MGEKGEKGALIRLCGRLSVEIGGEPRPELLHGRQGRLLLAYSFSIGSGQRAVTS